MKPEELMTYCGSFCGTCARSSDFAAFRQAASLLAELADAHGFQHWLPQEVTDFNYPEFRKALDFFADSDSWLVCKEACRGGCGGPPFCVRECCKQRNLDTCFECNEFPCDKTKPFKRIEERAEEYRRLGRDEWLRRQAEKASDGFEAHTGKYYQVRTSAVPPQA